MPTDGDMQVRSRTGIVRCGFGCYPWNKLPEVAMRALDSPYEVLGVGEHTLGLGELLWGSMWGR